jgi:alkanesulfonate monooxygenase SsuD/methylene tetrahydromethanopterin reductase-like flavin-dependent oxidoreductase (luciferase family)
LNRAGVTAEMAMAGGRMYAGNPDTVYRQIMEFYEKVGGFGQLIMVGKTGFITHDEAVKNITLFSKEVLPRLREIKPVVVE